MPIRTSFILLVFFSFLLLLVCCTPKKTDSSILLEETQDSVEFYVKLAKKGTTIESEEKRFLDKAYSLAIQKKNDTHRMKNLSEISLGYKRIKDSLYFRKSNALAMFLAKKIKDTTVMAESNWDLAAFFRRNTVEDSAYYHYGQAHKLFSELDNSFFAGRMLYNIALVQGDVKDYTAAEITTVQAIELLKPLNKTKQLYHCYNYLAIIANNFREFDKALEYHQKALEYLEKLDGNNTLSQTTKNNIGVVHQEKGNHLEAIKRFQEVLQFDSIKTRDPRLYAKTMNNLAYSLTKLGKTEQLPDLFYDAIKIQDSIGDISGIARSYYSLGEYYFLNKDTTLAVKNIKKAKSYAEQNSNNKRILSSLEFLSQLDKENAGAYSKAYIKLNDSLQQEERKARNKFARIRFETNETLEQNKLLARQKQLWTGISIVLVLLALAAFLFFDQRSKNQKLRFEQEQQANNAKIFNLMLDQKTKVEEGKKIAQKRISEELHDGVQGRLQGARMVLLGLNKRTTPEAIAERSEAIKELQDIQEEVRAISHELSHAAYQKIHNFINTITELLESIKASAQLQYTFEYDEDVEWDALDSDVKINLYRMVQESLQNCVKHAQANEVNVRFEVEDTELLKVSVADNGAGFEIKKGKKGIGLRNIASRIEKIGGHWDIQSTVGKGTTVYFSIPIALAAEAQVEETEKELEEL